MILINVDKVRVVPVPYRRSFASAGNLVITDSDFNNSIIKYLAGTIVKLANNNVLSMKTFDILCKVLHCRIEDVAVYIEENEDEQPVEGNEST